MAFEELITWSNQELRPDWQSDALRRLAATGELSVDDQSELRKIVEKATELIDDDLVLGIEADEPERRETAWRRGDPSPAELARIPLAKRIIYLWAQRLVENQQQSPIP